MSESEVPVSKVPEGQVPRDEKFWATYYAVQAEESAAFAILRCEEQGHEIEFAHGEPPICSRCGLDGARLLYSAGFVKVGDSEWTRRG